MQPAIADMLVIIFIILVTLTDRPITRLPDRATAWKSPPPGQPTHRWTF